MMIGRGALVVILVGGLCACATNQRSGLTSSPYVKAAARTPSAVNFVTLHSFLGYKTDGSIPQGSLVYLNGSFFGTTSDGGSSNDGTVFEMTPSGTEQVLHSFSGPDGITPLGVLTPYNGMLYGTTAGYGSSQFGTIFQINPSTGQYRLLHVFTDSDGGPPNALVLLKNILYGSTTGGGSKATAWGAIFGFDPVTEQFQVKYRFQGGTD